MIFRWKNAGDFSVFKSLRTTLNTLVIVNVLLITTYTIDPAVSYLKSQ